MSLRIAHVTATFPPYLGGTGNVCFQHARELTHRGHDVHVFTANQRGTARREALDGIDVTRLHSPLRYGNARLLPGLARSLHGFDVIHLHYPFIGGEIAAAAAQWNRIPLVITYHQDVLLKGPMRLVESTLRHTFGRLALRSASRVLFTTLDYGRSSYVYSLLRDRQHRIDELPNGVNTSFFHPPNSRSASRARLDLPVDHSIILLVAGLDRAHYFKGVDVFLDALSRMPGDVSAVIVGDGELRTTYERAAESAGLGSRLRFAGRVTNDDLRSYYQAADVTVLPSTTMGEAFGLVLVESMSCGTPVVASNLPGVRAVVTHEADGLLVDPGRPDALASALRTLLIDDELRERFGRQGRLKVERSYDWRLIGDRLEATYHRVIHERRTLVANVVSGRE